MNGACGFGATGRPATQRKVRRRPGRRIALSALAMKAPAARSADQAKAAAEARAQAWACISGSDAWTMMALASPCPSPGGQDGTAAVIDDQARCRTAGRTQQNAGPAGGKRARDLAWNQHPFGTLIHGCQMKIGGAKAFGEPPAGCHGRQAEVRQGAILRFPA